MAMATGKAQSIILEALGLTAWDNVDAENIFRVLGLHVIGKRVGRTSEPQVTVAPRGRTETRGAMTSEGEGDTWEAQVGVGLPIFDMTPILPWATNPDEAEAISHLAAERGVVMPTMTAIRAQIAREDADRRRAEREYRRSVGW